MDEDKVGEGGFGPLVLGVGPEGDLKKHHGLLPFPFKEKGEMCWGSPLTLGVAEMSPV